MQGALVVVLANLKPRKFKEFESHGMVMCASNEDHSIIELIKAPESCVPGDVVFFEGFEMKPD